MTPAACYELDYSELFISYFSFHDHVYFFSFPYRNRPMCLFCEVVRIVLDYIFLVSPRRGGAPLPTCFLFCFSFCSSFFLFV